MKSGALSFRAFWIKQAHQLPEEPGVYLMKDASGEVIYVGKAKRLKTRVASYFQEKNSDYRAFIRLLEGLLDDMETFVTTSEKEALLLERELIRRHQPRFNVIWRDDKQYLCLRVDTRHEYPWVQVVRNMAKDGARYFGPYHSATAARSTLRVVNRHFQLRTCRDSVLYNRKRPCLEYQIGRCPAPCVIDVDRKEYKKNVEDVLLFLEGRGKELAQKLREKMYRASGEQAYELAGRCRDQLAAVEKSLEGQKIASPTLRNQDIVALYREGLDVTVAVMEVRNGRVEHVVTAFREQVLISDDELLESFLLERYEGLIDKGSGPPPEIVLSRPIKHSELITEYLSGLSARSTKIVVPKRGERRALLELCEKNARHGFFEKRQKSGVTTSTLSELKDALGLKRVPRRMECFDISNLGSTAVVASGFTLKMVSQKSRCTAATRSGISRNKTTLRR